mmetsp:Transcript_10976/g.24176  ORF Transcript_10976/g.24176 Transcript_10976/m.24176 type:complete len:386 (-) Transcript_10976:8-1165(-)
MSSLFRAPKRFFWVTSILLDVAVAAAESSSMATALAQVEALSPSWCWLEGRSYERCCMTNRPQCWADEEVDDMFLQCCTGQSKLLESETFVTASTSYFAASPAVPPAVVQCMLQKQDSENEYLPEPSNYEAYPFGSGWRAWRKEMFNDFCQNGASEVLRCLASQLDLSVSLGLFLRTGCPTLQIANGTRERSEFLNATGPRIPEIFQFELDEASAIEFIQQQGSLFHPAKEMLTFETPAGFRNLQLKLVEATNLPFVAGLPRLWLLNGAPAGFELSPVYHRSPLDAVCMHRQELDLMVLDPDQASGKMHEEWLIIEHVCKPRRVLLLNTNMPNHATSWIFNRLLDRPHKWQLEMQGRYVLSDPEWASPDLRLLRTRIWALFGVRQ